MLKETFEYGALSAKLHGMRGKLLRLENYQAMAQMVTLDEIVDYLKENSAYAYLLESESAHSLNRDMLEQLLRRSLYQDFQKIRCHLHRKDRPFLDLLICRFEVDFLKMMIRVCLGEGSYANVVSVVSEEFFSVSSLNATRMRNASNMHSLLEALEGSRYYKVITSMYSREKEPTLFEFETTLDIYYFTQAKNLIDKTLTGKTKEDVEHCIGTEADLMNLLWIFRAKQYYNMSRELIYSFLIPVHYKLSDKQLIEIVESDDVNAVYEAAAKTKYAQVFEDESHKNHEKAVFRLLMRMFQKNGFYDLSAILTYSYAKELEIENISSVIEGVRYQVIPEKIMEYVVI